MAKEEESIIADLSEVVTNGKRSNNLKCPECKQWADTLYHTAEHKKGICSKCLRKLGKGGYDEKQPSLAT